MKPSEIRTELLEQHASLRALIQRACGETQRWARGETSSYETRRALGRLADALRRHNLREEELLRGVITKVDAWGPARAEIMSEEHVKEHQDVYQALLDAASVSDPSVTERRIGELRARMLEHMAREEDVLLREDVLRDDEVSVDAFGG